MQCRTDIYRPANSPFTVPIVFFQFIIFVPLVNSYQGSILFKFLKSVARSDATTEKDRSDRSFEQKGIKIRRMDITVIVQVLQMVI